MTTVICRVDNQWYRGLESASLTFTSPKGGYVRIDKKNLDKLSDSQRELIWKLYERVGNNDTIELNESEMTTLVVMGWAAGKTYTK
jgi:hypothetical protein